jgi:hypothetical protein
VRWEANYILLSIKLYVMNIGVAQLTSSWDGGRLRVCSLIGGKGGFDPADSTFPVDQRRPSNSTPLLNILCLYPGRTFTIMAQFFLFEVGRTGGSRPRVPWKQ